MAKKDEAKITFKAATEKFDAAIKDSKAEISRLSGELAKNSKSLKGNSDDTELLAQRVDLLSRKKSEQAAVVENLHLKLAEAKSAYKENSNEVKKMEGAVRNAEATLMSLGSQLDGAKDKLAFAETGYGQLTAEIKKQKSELKQLETAYTNAIIEKGKDSAEAKELEAEIISLNGKLRQNREALEEAETAARGLARGFGEAEGGTVELKNSLGELAAGTMIADFATNAISSLANLDEATQEHRVNMNQLETAYEHSGRTVDEAHDIYEGFLGIVGDSSQATEAALLMRNLADAGADVDKWYTIASGAATAFNGALSVESLVESANESLRCGQVVGGLADALNWTTINQEQLNAEMAAYPKVMDAWNSAISEGLSNEDAMNAALAECATEEERVALMTAALGTQYSEMGQQFQDANENVAASRVAADELAQSQGMLAEKIAPLQTAVTMLAADGIGFLAENLEIIAPIATAAAVSFGILAVALNITAIAEAATGAIAAVGAALSALSANPVVLVVAGLILIVTTIVTLWTQCESFRNFWIQFGEDLKLTFQKVGEFFSMIGSGIISTVTSIPTTVASAFSSAHSAITSKIGSARDFIGSAVNAIKGFFNFKISWPHVPVPKFSITPSGWKVGDLLKGSIPKLSITWHAKAMNRAMVLDSPTIFGYGNGSLLGAGEAGREVVSGESHLIGLIGNAVQKAVSNVSNHNEVNVTVYAEGDPDAIANKVAYKVFNAIDEANTRNGR